MHIWFKAKTARRLGQALAAAAVVLWVQTATASSVAKLPQTPPDIVGKATDPDTGDTVYLEHHYCSADLLACRVFYLRPNSQVIASKRLNYEPNLKAPELTFQDYRTDRELTIAESDADYVVDAGFDNFVRLQWQDLAEGEDVVFPFRLMDREKPITMRASEDGDDCASSKLCLEVRLDSWLLGSLVDPIELVYDRKSQRLLQFSGISNLKSDAGRSQKVDIRYQYLDESGVETSGVETTGQEARRPAGRPYGSRR